MGYILPITNYQAQHYQERVTQRPTDTIPIHRVHPKKIETRYYESGQKQMFDKNYNQNQFNHRDKNQQDPMNFIDLLDEAYAEITGIGTNFNYSI